MDKIRFTPEEEKYFRFSYNMLNERERLQTFKKWIFSDDANCSAAKLAEAGFYFCGNEEEPDCVQCFLCNKSLDGWEETDDPWKEHSGHAPYCNFAKMKKPERLLTLSQLFDMSQELIQQCIDKVFDDRKAIATSTFKQMQKEINALKK